MEWLKVLVLMFVCVYSKSSSNTPNLKEWSINLKRDFTNYNSLADFNVYWNVPTDMCKTHGINFEDKLKHFGIIVNSGDKFRGDEIVILYDPGEFPIMKKLDNGRFVEKNGGIPQKGNLDTHLKAFEEVIEKNVPKDFKGLGVLDFEVWRPVFRQNWNNQNIYKTMSIELEKKNYLNLTESNPELIEKQVNASALENFEKHSRKFMEETLKKAKELRPDAKWGYYGYPYCYGFRVEQTPYCPHPVGKENDQIQWLFQESKAFYPSIYVSSKLTTKEQKGFYYAKLNEAWRMVESVSKERDNFPPVYPYIWFKYNDSDEFLSQADINQALIVTKEYHMGGAVIWGRSEDVNTKEKCEKLLKYLQDDLGPAVAKVTGKNNQNSNQSS